MISSLPRPKIVPGPDLPNYRLLDIGALPATIEMNRNGMTVDVPYLLELSSQFQSRAAEIERELVGSIPAQVLKAFIDGDSAASSTSTDEDSTSPNLPGASESSLSQSSSLTDSLSLNLDSPSQIAKLIFDILRLHVGFKLKTTGEGSSTRISASKKNLQTIAAREIKSDSGDAEYDPNDLKQHRQLINLLLKYRELKKLDNTYASKLPRVAIPHPAGPDCPLCGRYHSTQVYKIHARVGLTRADTGRTNCTGPNLQNIPSRSKYGRQIRAGFIPEPGYKLISNDYSQIELRMLALESADPSMLKVYHDGLDIHSATAATMLGVRIPDHPKSCDCAPCKAFHEIRRGAKIVNFGVVFGLSAKSLQDTLILEGVHWPLSRCEQFILDWFNARPGVVRLLNWVEMSTRATGMTWNMWGGVKLIPEVFSIHRRVQAEGLRKAGNMKPQGGAAGFIKLAMRDILEALRTELEGTDSRLLMVIHDELLQEIPEDIAQDWCDRTSEIMGNVINVGLPILAEGNVCSYRWTK